MKKKILYSSILCLLTIIILIGCSDSTKKDIINNEEKTDKITSENKPLEISLPKSNKTDGFVLDEGNEFYDITLNQDIKTINFYCIDYNSETNKYIKKTLTASFNGVLGNETHTIRYTVPKDIANISIEVITYNDKIEEFIITYNEEKTEVILLKVTEDNMEK